MSQAAFIPCFKEFIPGLSPLSVDVRRLRLVGIGRKESGRQHTHTPDCLVLEKGQKCNWKQLKLVLLCSTHSRQR